MPNCLFWYWLLIGVMFIEESSPAWSSPVARALFKNSQTWYAWSRHQLTTGSMLTGADNQPWLEPDCQHLWYQKLKRSVNSRISWRFGFFLWAKPTCSTLLLNPQMWLCLTGNKLPNRKRFITKMHFYNKEIISQTQISLLFTLCLCTRLYSFIHVCLLKGLAKRVCLYISQFDL